MGRKKNTKQFENAKYFVCLLRVILSILRGQFTRFCCEGLTVPHFLHITHSITLPALLRLVDGEGKSEPHSWFDDVTSGFRFRRRCPPGIDFRTHLTSAKAYFSVIPTFNAIPTGNVIPTRNYFFRTWTSACTLLPLKPNLMLFLSLMLFLRVMLFLREIIFSRRLTSARTLLPLEPNLFSFPSVMLFIRVMLFLREINFLIFHYFIVIFYFIYFFSTMIITYIPMSSSQFSTF